MTVLSWPLAATIGAGALGCLAVALSARLWLKRRRRYESSASVADAYDRWTNDQLLERLWGDHIHLGYYRQSGNGRSRHQDFRVAKETFVHELARWSGLDQLPPGRAPDFSDPHVFPPAITDAWAAVRSWCFFDELHPGWAQRQRRRLDRLQASRPEQPGEGVLRHEPVPYRRVTPKVGRNDPCPCGSGKKFKKCCDA